MKDNPSPVKDPHVAFARAVVALAREHGVGMVDIHFHLASSRFFRERERYDHTRIRAQWAEGRHGDGGRITLQAEATLGVPETAEQTDEDA